MKLAFQSCKLDRQFFVHLRTAVTAKTRKLYNFIFLSFTLFGELNKFWHNGPNIFYLIWVCLGGIYETGSYHLKHVCHTIAVSCQGTVVRALDYECKGPDSKPQGGSKDVSVLHPSEQFWITSIVFWVIEFTKHSCKCILVSLSFYLFTEASLSGFMPVIYYTYLYF